MKRKRETKGKKDHGPAEKGEQRNCQEQSRLSPGNSREDAGPEQIKGREVEKEGSL